VRPDGPTGARQAGVLGNSPSRRRGAGTFRRGKKKGHVKTLYKPGLLGLRSRASTWGPAWVPRACARGGAEALTPQGPTNAAKPPLPPSTGLVAGFFGEHFSGFVVRTPPRASGGPSRRAGGRLGYHGGIRPGPAGIPQIYETRILIGPLTGKSGPAEEGLTGLARAYEQVLEAGGKNPTLRRNGSMYKLTNLAAL